MSQKFLNPVEVNGQVSAEYLDLSTTTTHTAGVGELVWNDTDGTMDIGLKGGNVKLQVGQEQLARVVNKTSPLINLLESDYQVVVITGATGQRLSVKLAQGNNDANSAGTLGVVTETINANQEGFITISGQVREINTTGSLQGETWSDGDLLFLSATTPGAITNIRPIAPNHTVNIGYVEYAHAIHGKIYVKVDNGYELGELHDVDTSESKTTPIDADNLLLQDSADLNVWKKLSWSNTKATLKTYFDTLYQSVLTNPITGTGTTNYLSKFTGTTSLGNSQIFDNGVNIGIGTTTPNSKFTVEGILATKPAGVNYYYSYLRSNWAADNAFELGISDDGASNFHKLITSSNYYNGSTLQFWTNDSERARFDISGNFGIGTTSAFSKVEIAGAATNWANSPAITFTDNAGTVNSRRWLIGNVATDYGSLNFAVSTTNSDNPTNPKMTITKEGNVGIGTTSPSNKLQVSTSGTALASFTGAEYSQFNIIGGSQNFYIQNYNSVSILGTKGASPLLFTTDETERMRITSSGNVGIGTSAPDFKLTVNGSAIFGATSINGNPTNDFSEFRGVGITDGTTSYGSYGGILLSANTQWTGSAKRFLVTNVLDANKFAIIRSVDAGTNPSIGTNGSLSSGTADFVINSSGNVGIGTSSPATKFEVSGRALVDQFQYTRALNISSANLNDYTFAGFYNGEAMTNAPNSGWFWVTVERYSGDANWVHQTATSFGAGNTANEVYTRTNSGGTWTNWKRLIDWTDINGTTNYVSKFTGNNSIGNSSIYDNGTNVGIGTTSPNYRTQIETTGADVFLTKNTSSTSFNRSYFYNNNNVGVQFLNFGSAYGFGTEFGVGQNGSVIQSNTTSAFAVGTSGAYPLLLGTTGSERMRIDSSGNVLVGQTSPIYSATNRANLTIGKSAGSIIVLGTSTAANGYLFYNNTDLELANSTSSGSVFFRTSGTERMRITSSGNVGIGTSSPNEKLTVSGKIYANPNKPVVLSGLGDPYYGTNITLASDIGSTQGANRIWSRYDGTGSGAITFERSTNSQAYNSDPQLLTYTESMRIAGNGNVGIGTTSPNNKLEVSGSIVSTGGGTFGLGGTFGFGSSQTSITGDALMAYVAINTGGSGEKMRITSTGNVGIGTTSPNFKLGIQASEPTFGILQAISNNNGGNATLGAKILFDVSGIGNFWEGMPSGANAWAVGLYNGSTNPEYMRITSGGNVGIGTTSPNSAISGDAKVLAISDNLTTNVGSFRAFGGGSLTSIEMYGAPSQIGIFGSTETPMIFSTNSSERMRITSTGNVGIGTSSPSEKLEVQNGTSGAKIKVSNTGGGYASLECSSNATSVAQLSFTNQLSLIGGNVGIGTSSPSYPLEVNGAIVSKGGGIGDLDGTIGFGSPGTSLSGNAVLGEMYFKTGGSEKMRINIAGNVGIGTSSPSNKLEVNGNAYFSTGSSYAAFQSTFSILSNYAGYNAGINSNLGTLDSNYNVILFASDTGNTYPASLAVQSDGSTSTGTTNRQQLSMEGLLQTETVPSDTTNPVKWIKVYNVDDNTHYFIPAYQ